MLGVITKSHGRSVSQWMIGNAGYRLFTQDHATYIANPLIFLVEVVSWILCVFEPTWTSPPPQFIRQVVWYFLLKEKRKFLPDLANDHFLSWSMRFDCPCNLGSHLLPALWITVPFSVIVFDSVTSYRNEFQTQTVHWKMEMGIL